MERVISATEARIHFGELMRRVAEEKTSVIVERGGKPQVVVLSIEEYERLRDLGQNRGRWKKLVDQSRSQIQTELVDRELTAPEEVIRSLREERDAQLQNLR